MFVAVFYWVLTVFFLIIYMTMTYTRIPQVPWTTVAQPLVNPGAASALPDANQNEPGLATLPSHNIALIGEHVPVMQTNHRGKYSSVGLCFNGSAFVLYLIAAIVDASSVTKERDSHNYNSWAASSFFAFVVTICYAGNTYFSFLSWRSRTTQ
ncbi:CKLF-like MARVEL transmembrane domain-containing protein 8 isoform 3-T3 [Sarcophilus harrisii]